jgi:hypothetical protein
MEITLDLAARVCRAIQSAAEAVEPHRWPTADRVQVHGGWHTAGATRAALRGAVEAGYVSTEGRTYYLTMQGIALLQAVAS